MEQDYIELLELQTLIREGVEDALPGTVRVRAEIAAIQLRSNGHCYLELSENGPHGPVAKARAVIWRSSWGPISAKFTEASGERLHKGITLVFEVMVKYSELWGLTLVIEDIDAAHTLGEMELARRRTMERLVEEGLMDLQKELVLPAVPYYIAVISAPDAAGYGDFRRHLLENEYGFAFDVTLFPATMQGEGAPRSIIDSLAIIGLQPTPPDAVFILRGGGSPLDLACFDDFDLCAAIARCPIPVFTAIGHDRDTHVADAVACGSVKTPTALADLCIAALAAEDERISELRSRIRLGFHKLAAVRETAIERIAARISRAVVLKTALESERISGLQARIAAADHRAVLSRGFALAYTPEGNMIREASAVQPGDTLLIRFMDGTIKVHADGKI